MTESDKTGLEISLPLEWALKKVFGATLSHIGDDFSQLYAKGRDKLITAATRKIKDNDGKVPNLRVTRDVLWNGAFSDEDICAEYFGGILASSRTEDGKDDSSIQFVDVIKSLSAQQLRLHYLIYQALNQLMIRQQRKINVAQGTEINRMSLWMDTRELVEGHEIDVNMHSNALWRHGLIHEYKTDMVTSVDKVLSYTMVRPTSFGAMLYAAAHNKWSRWLEYSTFNFGVFKDIALLKVYTPDLSTLQQLTGFPPPKIVDSSAGSPGPAPTG